MKRSLRKAHLWRSLLLAVLLPIGCGVAIWSRTEVPSSSVTGAERSIELVTTRSLGVSEATGLEARIARQKVARPEGPAHLVLQRVGEGAAPDLLVYWTAEAAGRPVESYGSEGAPTDLRLLGAVSNPSSFALPEGDARFAVVLYSLAHGEFVDGFYDVEPER